MAPGTEPRHASAVVRRTAGLAFVAALAACSSDDGDGSAADAGPAGGGIGGVDAALGSGGSSAGGAGGAAAAASCESAHGSAMVEVTAPSGARFCVDATEVTQKDYSAFVASSSASGSGHVECSQNTEYGPTINSGGPGWGGTSCPPSLWTPETTPNHPVVCVDWCDANAYCAWAGKRLCGRIGGGTNDLATAANGWDANASQWYSACSQGGKTQYPYGANYEPETCEGGDASLGPDGKLLPKKDVAASAGCRGQSAPYDALFDLSGSVAEWTNECFYEGPLFRCIARGGSQGSTAVDLTCDLTPSLLVLRTEGSLGFRCCKDLP